MIMRTVLVSLLAAGWGVSAEAQTRQPPAGPQPAQPPDRTAGRPVTAPEPNQLGGGDPGWEVRQRGDLTEDSNNLGGGDPGWEVQPGNGAGVDTQNLGGGDPGWEIRNDPAQNGQQSSAAPARQTRPQPEPANRRPRTRQPDR